MFNADPISRMIAAALLGFGTIGFIGLSGAPSIATPTPTKAQQSKSVATAPVTARAVTAPVAFAAIPALTATPIARPAPPAAEGPYVIKRALEINEPIIHGFWKWDDAGVPDGPVLITVDTVAQTISVFRGGYEIGVAVILYGANSKPTPNGVFPILQKKKDHISNLYGSPMPYMLRMTNDGISIHASDIKEGNATHGCVGVPMAFAKRLFAEVKLGDRVIVTSGERLQLGGAVKPL